MKPARLLTPAFACLAACVALAQQGAAPAPAVPPVEEDVPEVKEEWDFSKGRGMDPAMLARLNLLVPEGGRAHEGLRYPVYREGDAKAGPALESVFESRRVWRADDTHLQFEAAVFSTFDDAKSPDTATRTVSLTDAIYDLKHDLLYTSAPVKIDDKQVSIRSGGMVHDRISGLTIFTGGVELFVHEPPANELPSAAGPGAPKNPANPKSP